MSSTRNSPRFFGIASSSRSTVAVSTTPAFPCSRIDASWFREKEATKIAPAGKKRIKSETPSNLNRLGL